MERTCGECTACCKTHGVREISKERGAWCPHCEIGKGCRLYEERPQGCREFRCTWLNGLGGPDYRPDKINIVSEYRDLKGVGVVLLLWEVKEGELHKKLGRSWTWRNISAGTPVIQVSLIDRHRLYLPEKRSVAPTYILLFAEKEVEIISFSQAALMLNI
jgi:hypothetical protein